MKKETLTEKKSISIIASEFDMTAAQSVKEAQAELITNALILKVTTVKITKDEHLTSALEVMAGLKAYYKSKEDARKAIVDPINASVRRLNAEFKKITDRIVLAIGTIEQECKRYRAVKEAEAAAARAKEEIAKQKEREKTAKEFGKLQKGTRGETREAIEEQKQAALASIDSKTTVQEPEKTIAGTSFKKTWCFEVTDESKVPREFMSPDSAKIRTAVRAGQREIPGVRIFEDTILSTRT